MSKLSGNDTDKLKQLLFVFNDVFEWNDFAMPSHSHLQKMLNNPQHLVFTALLNRTVVGGLTAYILPEFESENSLVYIYDLAVKTEYQQQGIGKLLIRGICDYCSQYKELAEVFVQADEEDDYAVDFYRKTGGREMKRQAVHLFSESLNNSETKLHKNNPAFLCAKNKYPHTKNIDVHFTCNDTHC